jgi:hypothetical protein
MFPAHSSRARGGPALSKYPRGHSGRSSRASRSPFRPLTEQTALRSRPQLLGHLLGHQCATKKDGRFIGRLFA